MMEDGIGKMEWPTATGHTENGGMKSRGTAGMMEDDIRKMEWPTATGDTENGANEVLGDTLEPWRQTNP